MRWIKLLSIYIGEEPKKNKRIRLLFKMNNKISTFFSCEKIQNDPIIEAKKKTLSSPLSSTKVVFPG